MAASDPLRTWAWGVILPRMRRSISILTVAAAVSAAVPASACRAPADAGKLSARYKTIAIARVTSVQPKPLPKDVAEPFAFYAKFNWDAKFTVERFARGKTKTRVFHYTRRAGPGSCDFDEAPTTGDLWVLYVRHGEVIHTLPLDLARRIDSTLPKIR